MARAHVIVNLLLAEILLLMALSAWQADQPVPAIDYAIAVGAAGVILLGDAVIGWWGRK